jgi:hypothetical protein
MDGKTLAMGFIFTLPYTKSEIVSFAWTDSLNTKIGISSL